MRQALNFAKEIVRKEAAINKTKSTYLKNDYIKNIKESKEDLKFYCHCKGISYGDVMREARNCG